MSFRPVSDRQTLCAKVVEQIREAIADGRYAPGRRLPAERTLATVLRVSRTVVRDAFKTLEGLGEVEIRSGVGVFPLQPSPTSRTESLFEIRRVLEAEGAAMAALRAPPEALALLYEHQQLALAYVSGPHFDSGTSRRINAQFHELVAQSSQNLALPEIVRSLRAQLFRRPGENLSNLQWARRAFAEHGRVVAAIGARDPEAARWAMKEHLRDVEQTEIGQTVD